MRLKSLKLSGFKSFVDSTTFDFPSNLVGIVGPNGCGKSNSIDAVRWVMGERSAKHLRGESMADVIFNGAKTRKPLGKASVEMLFDNSEGRVQGEYAAYNEISVKREVTRDGQSNYYLNRVKVRRRDVMDIFLGTGLGPRSYAIIEQGMISRFVEAKPDDIRMMIEEAAGVSKYKERRRETENRIKHTKENLERIADLSEEIGKQLSRLDRQAKAAEKYKVLKQEQKLLKAQLLTLQWQQQNTVAKEWQDKISSQSVELEAQRAKLQAEATAIEKLHQQQAQETEQLSETQRVYYQTRSDLQSLEQKRSHQNEQREQIKQDLSEISSHNDKSNQALVEDQSLIQTLSAWMGDNAAGLATLQALSQTLQKERTEAEENWFGWQRDSQKLHGESAEHEKNAEKENAKIQQLEAQQIHLNKRLGMLEEEQKQLPEAEQEDQILLAEYEKSQEALENIRSQQHEVREKIKQSREQRRKAKQALDEERKSYQESRGRLVSLETLQQNMLAKSNNSQWLRENKLGSSPRLAETLQVKSGWERAVEVVLGDFLEAVCAPDKNKLSLAEASNVSVTVLQPVQVTAQASNKTTLASFVESSYATGDMLAGVYVASSESEALTLRETLQAGESVVTQDGLWFGPSWIRIAATEKDKKNVLQREQEIRDLRMVCEKLEVSIQNSSTQLESLEHVHIELEQNQETFQNDFNKTQQQVAGLQSQQSALLAKNEQIDKRRVRVGQELTEIAEQIAAAEKEITGARGTADVALTSLNILVDKKTQFEQNKQPLYDQFLQTKQGYQERQDELHQLLVEMESKKSQLHSTKIHVERVTQQLDSEGKRRAILQERFTEIETTTPALEESIKTLIQSQVEDEQKFKSAKQKLNDTEYAYQEKTKLSQAIEQKVQEVQVLLEKAKLQAQESVVRAKTLSEQLQQTEFKADDLLSKMGESANIGHYEQEAETVDQRIQRLGAINLAAIEEFKTESERKIHIDKQLADLEEALATLESAIAKIDRETKDRFKTTFDKVNEGVQRIFPELFGGGQAYLELTSDDLLHTGVTIMAQPPGKRNSTIHLLSGGEKALTAVSLVFAIFELNPAPFCMLDEVDAPLDDANVTRFCALVKKMSEQVQFIFITHNKVTMELSNQLMGVTMHEAGVSRLVAVDVQEAAEMVGS